MSTEPIVEVGPGHYKGWNSWHLKNDALELVLVPQVGGRIMSMIWRGRGLSFAHPDLEGHVQDLSAIDDMAAEKMELGFLLWGGDKTWLAPQARWTEGVPFLDLDSGQYELSIEESGPNLAEVQMISPVCRETGVQITRTVRMSAAKSEWTVTHGLTNRSSVDVEWGIWDVCMVLKPGQIYLPKSSDSQYLMGVKTFEEEGESTQVRDHVVEELGSLAVIQCRDSRAFKFGVDASEGWLIALIEVPEIGLVGYRKEVPVHTEMEYGHGCVSEVYNSDQFPYFEIEIHGPLIRLQPGESFELEERQSLFEVIQWPATEAEVRNYL